MNGRHYHHLALMALLSFLAMYLLMYAMVNAFENVFSNFNQVYMAGLMTAPMVLIELIVMRGMYPDKRKNSLFIAASVLAAVAFFMFIRAQALVADRQFVRSMIPHHASAILMCERAEIGDPEIKELCRAIVSSQQKEIDQMKTIMRRLEN